MKFSIVTICRNEGPSLKKTLQSVQDQTCRDFEHIFIDGLSEDPATLEIIKQYQNTFSYFVSEKDNGIYSAQNKGLRQAKGEFVIFLNAGDALAGPEVLSQVALAMQQVTADVYYGNMWLEQENGSLVLGEMPREIHLFHMLRSTLWHPVSFIRRDLFEKFGVYNENFKIVSDYEFFLKLVVSKCVTFFHLGAVISIFNLKGIGSSPQHQTLHLQERLQVQKTLVPRSKRILFEVGERLQVLKNNSWLREFFKKRILFR